MATSRWHCSSAITCGRCWQRESELRRRRTIGCLLKTMMRFAVTEGLRADDPSVGINFIGRKYKPFTAAGFGNWFRDRCDEAGLPNHCAAHGLRKAACRRLAEAGCSANIIAAISGHTTLREVERYSKAADQERLARQG